MFFLPKKIDIECNFIPESGWCRSLYESLMLSAELDRLVKPYSKYYISGFTLNLHYYNISRRIKKEWVSQSVDPVKKLKLIQMARQIYFNVDDLIITYNSNTDFYEIENMKNIDAISLSLVLEQYFNFKYR